VEACDYRRAITGRITRKNGLQDPPSNLPPSLPPSLPHLGGRNDRHISGDEGSNVEQVPPRVLNGDAMQNEIHALEGGLEGGREGGREGGL